MPYITVPSGATSSERVIAADPVGRSNPALVAAAQRAGGTGLLDVRTAQEYRAAHTELVRRRATGHWLRPGGDLLALVTELPPILDEDESATTPFTVVVLDVARLTELALGLPDAVAHWRTRPREQKPADARRIVLQVTSRDEALEAVAAGADGLLAVGCEAGGRIGETQSFVLLQQLADLGVPVWLRGGAGLHTTAAVIAGGGAGVVLDSQLGLLTEARLPAPTAAVLQAMDGSETRVLGGHRFYLRPDLLAARLDEGTTAADLLDLLGDDLHDGVVPFGQDAGVASSWATRYVTVGGAVRAVLESTDSHLDQVIAHEPLAPGAGVCASHGTRYPIAQGPMTRVSDRAPFAAAVAEGGALPFLALALLPAAEVRALLQETAELLGERPWGVGLLGFAPAELLAEQLAVVHEFAPPFALVAGGRPSQSAALEEAGISSYLHVPSPGLLDRFLADGARSFVFEGRECGGHVGPRSSFALWEAQVERLLEFDDPSSLRVLLAGGIHDARSAAMAGAVLAPLAARGAQVGVLMGTGYLFTAEAVSAGAVTRTYQEIAVDCERTVLVETAPGHATRCVETGFVRAFIARKEELQASDATVQEQWAALEQLNLGRLRIAAKGLTRTEAGLTPVDTAQQLAEGMYMIGTVATLRDEITTIDELHASVSAGSVGWVKEHLALGGPHRGAEDETEENAADPFDIAIVGMESFLPGAVGADDFWANVLAGSDHVTEVPSDRWDASLYFDAETYEKRRGGHTTPSRWGGFLEAIGFDPLAYGIPPASLAAIEPVQLLSLEVAARALADAGYASRGFDRSRASVIFGAESGNELGGAYGVRAFLPQLFGEVPEALQEWLPTLTEDSFPGVLANVIAGRIANRLDLGGVNYTVDAACGSSLAALDAACKELRSGASDLVIAGGADLHNGLNDYLMFSSVHALSPTGRCRTFDAEADGIALGEGIAAVVLKRRVDAERDGDRIYAIIDAVAGSSDGRHLGLTAPRKEGQQRAVVRAWESAGVQAGEIGLVEAHGTGTVVGDRTEMATLTELFAEADVAPGSVVLGSVKSQIGHTKCTAGLAGLIKVARALHHRVLPPTVNLSTPNPYYDPENSPFRFHDRPRPWGAHHRRAGVSAFGFGGTNFHAVLSSYDAGERPAHGVERWPAELFVLRAEDEASAAASLTELRRVAQTVVEQDPTAQRHRLRDLARTVSASRGEVRAAFVAGSFAELLDALDRAEARGFAAASPDGSLAFLYPGQGSQRPGMLSDLFVTMGGLDDLVRLAAPWTQALFPPAAFTREERAAQQAAITATDVAQPTLGIAALAMTRLLTRVGVVPDAAAGHSYGELAALAAAGSFDDETLVALSSARGQAVLEAISDSGGDPGTMAALALDIHEVRERLIDWRDIVVANHNAPRQVVVSGPTSSVRAAVERWESEGVRATLLPVACAFHSPLVGRASELLASRLGETEVKAPRFPVWSNVTGTPYPDGTDAGSGSAEQSLRALLAIQVSEGVRFVDQIESMYAAGVRTFVEAGPGRVLAGQVAKILGDRPHRVIATDVPGEPGVRRFLEALAELALAGVEIDPTWLFEGRAAHVDLAAWPTPAPQWTIDGAFVRGADGAALPNSFQPAPLLPSLPSLPSARTAPVTPEVPTMTPVDVPFQAQPAGTRFDDVPSLPSTAVGSEAVVTEYLRSMRQIVAAERDVVLQYLGAAPAAAPPAPILMAVPEARVPLPVAPAAEPLAEPTPAASASVPASVPASAPSSAPTPAPATEFELMAVVQQIVSTRTGYPVDMLDPTLDLEADLSIDSIKRIEIVGELADTIGLTATGATLDDDIVEELSRHKTLTAIVEWIRNQQGRGTPPGSPITEPAGAARPTGAPAGAPTPAPATEFDLMAVVQQIVSTRTGYPVDMLDPTLDLEADLSIDSIKRIEIVGELADTIGLTATGATLDDDIVEELSRHKTLTAIVDWIRNQQGHGATATPVEAGAGAQSPVESADELVPDLPAGLFDVIAKPLGPVVPLGSLDGSSVALVPGHPDLTEAVETILLERGAQVARTSSDPTDESLVAGVDVVVDLSTTSGDPRLDARDLFATIRPALLGRAQRIIAVGVSAHSTDDSTGAGVPTGVPGLFRSLARERDDLLARSVEISQADLGDDLGPLASSLVDELLDLDAPPALSWVGGVRTTRVAASSAPVPEQFTGLDLDEDAVVVLTGGARGITARIAEGIARSTPCRLVLVGRSPYPQGPEDPRLHGVNDPVALRSAVVAALRADGLPVTPAEVEQRVSAVIGAREITQTLTLLRDLGSDAEYVEMDVRAPGFGALLDALHATFGRLDGVIHGAGVLDDRLVRDKTADGFDRVFGTKVDGARAILDRQHLGLRFVVLFGSVSGVFGNKGQVDYAAANDALDTLARLHDGRHDCHVVALDWGPWAGGGMVSPELEREYARRGVGLLAPRAGVAALLHEVARGTVAQRVVMSGSPEAFAPTVAGRGRRESTAGLHAQPDGPTGTQPSSDRSAAHGQGPARP